MSQPHHTHPRPNVQRPPAERRFTGHAHVHRANDSLGYRANLAVSVLHLSETRLRVVLSDAVAPKEPLKVMLVGSAVGTIIKRLAWVADSSPAPDGTHRADVAFHRPLTEGELELLVDTPA